MATKFLDIQPTQFLSRVASADIAAHVLVTCSGDTCDYAQTDSPWADGVLLHDAKAGDAVRIACGGILPVIAGETLAPHDWLVSGDDGVAFKKFVMLDDELSVFVGFALTAAAAGELVMVYWAPHTAWSNNTAHT